MKIIHCADIHLDAKMTANLGSARAAERRSELLGTFHRMAEWAAEHDVAAILIAGDLFDVKKISVTARNAVLSDIRRYPQIRFYYLRGNHDRDNFTDSIDEVPKNLQMFDTGWTYCTSGNVCICAAELTKENADSIYSTLLLRPECFNIVMLHGQESPTSMKGREPVIDIKRLKNRGIDYLALGHVHAYKREQLDGRGIYCYPGCLEGRGFDECGPHGFVLLDIDESRGTFTDTFIPFAKRLLYEVPADVTGLCTSAEMAGAAARCLREAGCGPDDLVKLVLTGAVGADAEKDADYIRECFSDDYYFLKLCDETRLRVDERDYLLDESLKGEFVRLVIEQSGLSEEDQAAVIGYGLKALAGEKQL